MHIYLLRHEKARERALGFPDAERELTPEGLANAMKKAKKLKKKLKNLSLILASPYPRAWQTAEIYARTLGILDRLKSESTLSAGSDARQILKHLAENFALSSQQKIMLVGHESWLSELASLFICGNTHAHLCLKKGGVMKLVIDKLTPQGGHLVWLR